jgi:hypothetical protein
VVGALAAFASKRVLELTVSLEQWWTGMIVMIIGELMNLIAYSFTDAILVSFPLRCRATVGAHN